jgi:hypothetical protein
MKIEKVTDIFKSKKEEIKIIKQRRLVQKITRMHKKKHIHRNDYDNNSNIRSYKHHKAKKEFKSVLNDKIKKVEEHLKPERSSKDMIVMMLKMRIMSSSLNINQIS